MNQECLCETSSEYTEEKNEEAEEENIKCNKIFLNFDWDSHIRPLDKIITAKVKDLFKVLSERQDLQDMKVSGFLDEGKQEEDFGREEEEGEIEDNDEDNLDSMEDDQTPRRGGGQRFTMSRDFWYRKLNTLKAQKLDEAALEAKDMPPDKQKRGGKYPCYFRTNEDFPNQSPEKSADLFDQINLFERTVAKPVEKKLKKEFVNVYDNRSSFKKKCN